MNLVEFSFGDESMWNCNDMFVTSTYEIQRILSIIMYVSHTREDEKRDIYILIRPNATQCIKALYKALYKFRSPLE